MAPAPLPFDLRPLDGLSDDDLREALGAAFSDYLVPVRFDDREALAQFLRRQGVDLTLSMGAFRPDAPQMLGVVLLAPQWKASPPWMRLATMGIRPEARGLGVARPLLSAAIASAWSLGAEEMRLEVFAQNARALALYTAMGFKPLHRLYGYELELAQDAIADCPIPIPNRLDASTAQQWLQARQPQDQAFQMSASMVPLLPPDTLFWQSGQALLAGHEPLPGQVTVSIAVDRSTGSADLQNLIRHWAFAAGPAAIHRFTVPALQAEHTGAVAWEMLGAERSALFQWQMAMKRPA